MTLEAFFFFLAGALGEISLLWNGARHSESHLAKRFAVASISLERLLALGLIALAIGLGVVLRWLDIAKIRVSLDDGWVAAVFVVLGLFLLGTGVIGDRLLPRVDERTVLVVQLLVAILTLTAQHLPAWPALITFVGLPLIVSFLLAVSRQSLAPPIQALVYFGYLLALLALTFQTANLNYFSALDLDNWQALAFGGLFIFLLLHALFAVRFSLIVSSLILPRNRPLIGMMMPRLYSNEQVPLLRFGLFAVLLAGLVLLNMHFQWVAPEILVSLAVMVSAQGMGTAKNVAQKVTTRLD
jgi:hypothetical protein